MALTAKEAKRKAVLDRKIMVRGTASRAEIMEAFALLRKRSIVASSMRAGNEVAP